MLAAATTYRVFPWALMLRAGADVPAPTQERCVVPFQRARSGNYSSTFSDQASRKGSLWADPESDVMLTRSATDEAGPAVQGALSRIRHLGSLEAGWDGTDVAAPIPAAIKDAMALVVEMANAGIVLRPRIGLDSDGSVSFMFVRDRWAVANLTIAGDGTYSFYARSGGHVASMDDARVGWPIPRELLQILAS
jgi:hypothetical protein